MKIPFDIPEYLAEYLASRVRKPLIESKGNRRLLIDRRSHLGRLILESLEVADAPTKSKNQLELLISHHSGDHYKIPRGKRNFLRINPEKASRLFQYFEDDFSKKLISFVEGAEYAHRVNGWTPDQKRKGIRKKAIFEFCIRYNVIPSRKNMSALVKKYQRHTEYEPSDQNNYVKKIGEVLSF